MISAARPGLASQPSFAANVIGQIALIGFYLSPFPQTLEVPESENPVQLVPVSQSYDNHADPNPHKNVKPDILVVSQVAASKGEQDRAEKPACASNDKKLCCGQMPQAENVTQPVLGKPRDQEKEKDKEGRFMVKEVVKALYGGFGDKLFYEGPAECSCKDEGEVRTESESDGREHDSEKLTKQVPSENACHLTGNRCGNHLSDLKQDKDNHRPRAQGVQIVRHSLFV